MKLIFRTGIPCIFFLLLLCISSKNLLAQTSDSQITKAVLQRDSLFWFAYNTCDTLTISDFYTDDVEFYHDKGGFSKGKDNVVASFKKNLCTDKFRLRREALDSTVKLFLLKNSDTVYGAILSGEHFFYVLEKDKKERLDGWAKFTHTWILQDGAWKMTRILSYDHKPAPYINKRKATTISTDILDRYAGEYKSNAVGAVVVKRKNQDLALIIKGKEFIISPESATVFFSKERDLTFEFLVKSKSDRKIIVRENSNVVEEITGSK